jgi:adenosine deaminase
MHAHQPLDTALEARVRRLPKAELHFHFEGALRWSTIRELHPDGKAFSERDPWLHGARPFADFQDFSQVFRDYIRPATGTPVAIERHAYEMLADLARQNVRYVEILLAQKFHTMLGLGEEAVWRAAVAGCRRAMAQFPIDARLFLGISRNQPPAQALQALEEIAAFALPRGWISGIDLQGDERLGEQRAFVDVYKRAATLRLKLRAHAGEICGAQNVRDAALLCGVQDISHGVRAIEDPALVRELARLGVCLHVCPTSNLMLREAPGQYAKGRK